MPPPAPAACDGEANETGSEMARFFVVESQAIGDSPAMSRDSPVFFDPAPRPPRLDKPATRYDVKTRHPVPPFQPR